MGHGSGSVGHETAPRLADPSGPVCDGLDDRLEPLLRSDVKGVLEAKWVLEVLRKRYPEQFQPGQARTLQRRFRDWRARHGIEPEVFFQQVAVPGAKRRSISRMRPTSA